MDTLDEIATFESGNPRVKLTRLTFNCEGTRVAAAATSGVAFVWDTDGPSPRRPIGVLVGHAGLVHAITFSPDGRRIATGGADQTIRIWDAETFEELTVLTGHRQYVWSLAFSPDGQTLVSGSGDSTVRLWDTAPLAVRLQARRDRRRILERLEPEVRAIFAARVDPLPVLEQIEADSGLGAREKELAKQVVLRISVERLSADG